MKGLPHRSANPGALQRNFLFWIAAALFIALSLKAGFLGNIGKTGIALPWNGIDSNSTLFPAGLFILIFWAQWALCIFLLLVFPRNLTKRDAIFLILLLALLCRMAMLFQEPSDDVNRYLWEGRLLSEGINPYNQAPADPVLLKLAKSDPFHRNINHPELSAAYPPFVLYVFAVLASISYNPMIFKIILLLFDLGTIGFLFSLLNFRGLDLRWSILYALNPVVLSAFAGQGHFDVMQLFFLTGALCFYDKKKWGWMFLFAGLAVQIKYVAAVVFPFLINRNNVKQLWIGAAAIFLPFLPFFGDGFGRIFSSILTFEKNYAFNGSIHALLRWLLGGIHQATTLCNILFITMLLFGFRYFHPVHNRRYQGDPISGCFYATGLLLLLAPTVHFWYITWMIPFLVLHPSRSWIVLCLTISFSFMTHGIFYHTGNWEMPAWAYFMEWLPFYLLLIFEIWFFWKQSLFSVEETPPMSVSVVIPARNEEKRIGACIRATFQDKAVKEVIVVDAASTDRTAFETKRAGGKVVSYETTSRRKGNRGGQIRAGIMAASGDVVAVVHADTLVTTPIFTRMLHVLRKQPAVAGGAVGGVFESRNPLLRLIEIANDFRAVLLGISFGDQVQFFRRRPVLETDLFPDIPLMEDVEFGIRLHRLGRQVYLFKNNVISARGWNSGGYGNAFLIVYRVSAYLLKRVWGTPNTETLYRLYYDKRGEDP